MFDAKPTTDVIAFPSSDARDMLTPILREGARKMLAMAIELEAQAWIDERSTLRDESGRRLVVRNGISLPDPFKLASVTLRSSDLASMTGASANVTKCFIRGFCRRICVAPRRSKNSFHGCI